VASHVAFGWQAGELAAGALPECEHGGRAGGWWGVSKNSIITSSFLLLWALALGFGQRLSALQPENLDQMLKKSIS